MIEENIKILMSLLGDPDADLHNDWVIGACPLAFARHRHGTDSRPSFGIHVEEGGKSGYHCFSCQLHGKSLDALMHELTRYHLDATFPVHYDLATAFKIIEEENTAGYFPSEWKKKGTEKKKFEPWPEWWLKSFPSVFKFPEAIAYLNNRGIVPTVANHLDLRFDPHKQIVCFPIRTGTGKLAGMRGRFMKPMGDFRYYDYKWNGINNTALVLLGEQHIDPTKPVVVVEGPFDYAKVYRVYRNVVANLTTSLSIGKVKRLKTMVKVVSFFDDDVAGVEADVGLAEYLKGVVPYTSVTYPSLPPGKEKQDPGDLSITTISKMLKQHVPLDNLIS